MSRRGERDRGKERFWRRMCRRWRRSGQSVRAFCAEHGLSEPSFYNWRQTIAERDQQAARDHDKRRAGSSKSAGDPTPVFVPLRLIDAPAPAVIEVVLERGRIVRVMRGFDAGTLRQLLAVLDEERPC